MAANPTTSTPLALDREARAIRVELERSGYRDRFQLETRWAAQPLDLLRELRKLRPAVLHFSGVGRGGPTDESPRTQRADRCSFAEDPPDGLYFQAPDARPQLVSAQALRETLAAAGSSVRLVVLSACYSDAQVDVLRAQVDCVVGMTGSLRDDAARSFAIGFYGGLGDGESVADAFRQGCAAITLEGLRDAERPRCAVRDGVDASRLTLGSPAPAGLGELSLASPVSPKRRG